MAERKRKWDEGEEKPSLDAAAAAAAVAARIASQHGTGSPSGSAAPAVKEEKKDLYDGAFTHDIDINDIRNRYLLTKGSTQQQIAQETGASVVTKGIWIPDRSKASPNEQPLYIHISAPSQPILDAAIKKVNEAISSDLGPLVEDRSRFAKNREKYFAEEGGRRKWAEEKIQIGLESMRNFNIRAKVVGPGGLFVKYIQQETGTRVQIKGLGSGFIENDTGREAEEPMHVFITGPDDRQISAAKDLAEDLLVVVREEYQKAMSGMGGGGGGGYGGGGGGGGGGYHGGGGHQGMGYGGQQQGYGGYAGYQGADQQQQQGQQPPLPAGASPAGTTAGASATPAAAGADGAAGDPAAQYEQYKAYWAAYGYDVEDPAFKAWQAQQQAAGADMYGQQQGQAGAAGGTGAAAAAPAAGGA